MTHTHCDFCEAEIPSETLVVVLIEAAATSVPAVLSSLKRDACQDCAATIRRIIGLVDGKQLKQILESVTHR